MRIGIDCRTILNPEKGEKAGVGHYTLFLIRNLLKIDQENEYVLFFDEDFKKEQIKNVVGEHKKVKICFLKKGKIPFLNSHVFIAGKIRQEKCDVFHAPGGILPFFYKGKSIITIHDLAIYKHPEWFPENFIQRFISTKILVPRGIKLANYIIVPSEATKKDCMEIFGLSAEKILMIPHGVELPFEIDDVRDKYQIHGKYFLFIGTVEPRKNLIRLIHAFQSLKNPDYFLIIAGGRGWKSDDVFLEIEKTQNVRYLGYINESDKFSLMKYATAFVFPSLYEGFGLPVLEARAVGTRVITSNISSLPEVAREGSLLVDPYNESEIGLALKSIINSKEQGRNEFHGFSWEKTAGKTLNLYNTF
ncbi:MAG: mannosyltransferase B-like protein [Parcubacteria group bacterium GW2011_GWC2_39_14]|nr:MAG: mannosyltransferase B-like protein [Parcubacteria group bacterium GW2011_GWC2_39_14]